MTAAAFHFEAKKYALRQAKDGVIVSFVVHPNDVVAELLSAPIGEHYVVALAPYTETAGVTQQEERPPCKREAAGSSPAAGTTPREKKRLTDHPRPTQAGILCNDEGFRQWFGVRSAIPEGASQKERDVVREADAKRHLCQRLGITSRSELAIDGPPAAAFDAIVADYLDSRLPEPRG